MGGIISAIGGMFNPKLPSINKEVMPDPQAPGAKIKAREEVAKKNKGGRDSTIFTGQAYGSQNLGGTA